MNSNHTPALQWSRDGTIYVCLINVGVVGIFIDMKSFRSHYRPGVDSAYDGNEYQEHFLGVKTAGA